MKTLFIDPVGGIAGDMLCAALMDLGLDEVTWRRNLKQLSIDNYNIQIWDEMRGAFKAKRMEISPQKTHQSPDLVHAAPVPSWDENHRHYSDIIDLIDGSNLPTTVKSKAKLVFKHLAEAEAKIHNTDLESVHFHEVGAIDSILDIVGFCIGLDMLEIEQILNAPPPVSTGTIKGAHGVIPLPAPATLELLEDRKVRSGTPGMEQTTPTGAAILKALSKDSEFPEMIIIGSGYGAGKRKTHPTPNLLRLTMGNCELLDSEEEILCLQTHVDDMTGEDFPILFERLLDAGALDVFCQPIQMKKSRNGILINVLCRPDKRKELEKLIYTNTSTLGIRRQRHQRSTLRRRWEEIKTDWGLIRIKIGEMNGADVNASVEYEDAAAAARLFSLPLNTIREEALRLWRNSK